MRKLTIALVVAVLFVACGDSNDGGDSSATTAGDTATTTAAGTQRIAAYITKVDINEGELTYDEIKFLTGDAAKNAYRRDNPDDPDGPPNDYYIDKGDATLKTVPISPRAEVTLNILANENPGSESRPGTVVELADSFVKGKLTPDGRDRSEIIAFRPFWITLDDNVVTKIDEQYTP